MDGQSVYSLSVLAPDYENDRSNRVIIQKQLENFILEFQLGNTFIYRDQIRENVLLGQHFCQVDVAHLIQYNEELAAKLITEPADIIPLVSTIREYTVRVIG
jgi:DNA replication licensing factor MCM5